jgi:glycosyltransferase involved in cell wall biosynthesis
MKVTFFRHSLLSRGGDKMIVAHATHLAEVGHQVTIKTNKIDTVFEINPLVKIESLPFFGKFGTLLSAATVCNDCDRIVADIIPLAFLLAVRNRTKVVYFAQDYDESYYSLPPLKLLVRFCYFLSLRLLRVPVIAVSNRLAELLKERFNADVIVVENGVDTDSFHPDPDPDLIDLKGDRRAILLLSRNDWRKGFDLARKVIESIGKTHQHLFEVWTVGESCTGIFPNTVHRDFGYVNEERLRELMSSADVFLYPSRHEGLPLMPLEAMACGCSIVTTIAVPYAVHEENALVSQIGDSDSLKGYLRVLLEDDYLHSRLVETGKIFASNYSLAAAKQKFEAVLAGMVQR